MKHLRMLALAATALIGAATAASAQQAFTTDDVNLRAGPGSRYPVVSYVPEDAIVYIHGCLSNWNWCDVSWRRHRGWMRSGDLEVVYHNRRIDFDEYRDYVDIPFVTFGFGYWDRYYRDRPWYDNWDQWGDRRDRMRWREQHGGGDWNHDGNWNDQRANDNTDQGDRTARGDRRYQDGQSGPDRMRCAPDDPNCGGERHHRRYDQQDQQDQTDQQQ